MHGARLGRFLSIDPLAPKYPFYSPYAFSGNRVIDRIELEGLEPKKGDINYGRNIVIGGPQHEATISNAHVSKNWKSGERHERNENWIYKKASNVAQAADQIESLKTELGEEWNNQSVNVFLQTHGSLNSMVTSNMYAPLERLTGKENRFFAFWYISGEEIGNLERYNEQAKKDIADLGRLLQALPEGSSLILGACLACDASGDADALGKALVHLGNNRVNIYINQDFTRNPIEKGATGASKEDYDEVRFLDVPLGTSPPPGYNRLQGWIFYPKNGGDPKVLHRNLQLNSSGEPLEQKYID